MIGIGEAGKSGGSRQYWGKPVIVVEAGKSGGSRK